MTDDPLGAADARAEERGLFGTLGHDSITVEDLRELIAFPPRIELTPPLKTELKHCTRRR